MSEIQSQAIPASDELAEVELIDAIRATLEGWPFRKQAAAAAVEVMKSQGWSKPRTVHNAAELDALPELSVVLVGGQLAAQKDIDWYAIAGGDPIYFKPDAWETGIVVLFTPSGE
ncbi:MULTISPECIES: hypothetical protein [Rhodococcus erythropolis group]|uniref:Uncharacterized protein n=2 Tax=Rhodococcus TaxID=1827 RepID=A0ABV5XII8_9NOCA|nr:hypothetical protein [Rhodococcus qingshengii]KLN71559.1 hypothetical protein ABM90_11350 [Rhodococcus erythropolis]MBP1054520.1 hypothetical protein [Rhodococcus qingshengii]